MSKGKKADDISSERQFVAVALKRYRELARYRDLTGVPIAKQVDEALGLYIDNTLAARQETLANYCKGDRLTNPDLEELMSPEYTEADVVGERVVLEGNGGTAATALDLPSWATVEPSKSN